MIGPNGDNLDLEAFARANKLVRSVLNGVISQMIEGEPSNTAASGSPAIGYQPYSFKPEFREPEKDESVIKYRMRWRYAPILNSPRSVVDLDALVQSEAKDLQQSLVVEIGRLRKRGGRQDLIETLKELRTSVKGLED